MPRRNKHKKDTQIHKATIYDENYIDKCYGCAFAGKGFVCQLEGKCLLNPLGIHETNHVTDK